MISYQTFENKESIEWVTFVHGAGGSSNIWYKQLSFFKERFNVLMVDLRGHGDSADSHSSVEIYQFDDVARDITEVLDKEGIKSTHLIGVSLGSMVVKLFINQFPERSKKAVLCGMIVDVNFVSKALLFATHKIKTIFPTSFLYKVLAKVILPKRAHKESKNKFLKEAKKLSKEEFLKWFKLTYDLDTTFTKMKQLVSTPILYAQGSEDYLFLQKLKDLVALPGRTNEQLEIFPNCGHLVNLQKPKEFNVSAANFLLS